MSNRSSSGVPERTVRGLGLPARTVTALHRAGVDSVADLAALTRTELAGIAGLGPGSIAAIRAVVPEPPPVPATTPGPVGEEPVEEESPDAPAIPSFDSLRDPRRRTAFDVLAPAPPAAPSPAPSPAPGPAPGRQAPPAEYADLLRWGVHLAAAAVGVPLRVARWSIREPLRGLRRLLGD